MKWIVNGISKASVTVITESLEQVFNNLDKTIQGAVDLVTMPADSISGIWSVVTNIHGIILPMGYSLLTLFFLLGFMNKSMSFKVIRIEDIVKLLLKMIIAKVVMEKSFELLNMIYGIVTALVKEVNFYAAPIKIVDTKALAEQIAKMNFFEKIVFEMQFTPISIANFILDKVIFVIVYGRLIEQCIFTAVSPIPIATLSSEEYASVSKRFFQHYIGISLHGLIIVVICMIFGGLAQTFINNIGTDTDFGVMASITLSITLMLVLSKSGTWARQITGVN